MRRRQWILLLIFGQMVLLPLYLQIAVGALAVDLPYCYAGLVGIGAIFLGSALFAWRSIREDRTVIALSLLCGMLCNLCFFITVPVTVDRSISVYFLSKLYASPDRTITRENVQVLMTRYMQDTQAADRRLKEQAATGTLRQVDGDGYIKTPLLGYVIGSCAYIGKLYAVKSNACLESLESGAH